MFLLRQSLRKPLYLSSYVLLAAVGMACGGGGSTPPEPQTPQVNSVTVTPGTTTVVVGSTTQLSATVAAVNGAPNTVTWESSSQATATVSQSGLVQGVAPGTVTITARSTFDNTKSGNATITVNPPPAVNAVTIAPPAPVIVEGESLALTATVTAVGGASTAVTWTSSNQTIVSVTTGGTITGVAIGSAEITATSVFAPTVSATVTVTVNAAPPSVVSVSVLPQGAVMVAGDELALTADVVVRSGASTDVTWSSSDNSVATVATDGKATAVAVGTVTITATSVFDATKSGSTSITVNPKPAIVSVTITNPPTALIAGTKAQLSADVTAVGGAATGVTWSTSNAAFATVSTTGEVSAVAAGNVTITATSDFDATKQGSAAIRIDASPIVTSVTVTPATLSLTQGAFGQLTAAVEVGNNASKDVTWSSSDEAIATVDGTGRVTAVAQGSATIRATAQADATRFGESVVTVTGPAFPTVADVSAGADSQFDPAQVDIAVGGTVTWQFGALAHTVTFAATAGVPNSINASSNTSVSRTFTTAGTFTYECTLHAGMDGRVIVH